MKHGGKLIGKKCLSQILPCAFKSRYYLICLGIMIVCSAVRLIEPLGNEVGEIISLFLLQLKLGLLQEYSSYFSACKICKKKNGEKQLQNLTFGSVGGDGFKTLPFSDLRDDEPLLERGVWTFIKLAPEL